MNGNLLFLDTETTGFKKSGLIVEGQARVVQLGMILTDKFGKSIMEFCTMIRHDKQWSIGDGAQAIHGKTDDDCQKHGISFDQAFYIYQHMADRADKTIAHNAAFDKSMMEVEAAYVSHLYASPNETRRDNWYCTMNANAGLSGGKSLANCYKHYTGKEIKDAHDAMADTRACMAVYFAMCEKSKVGCYDHLST